VLYGEQLPQNEIDKLQQLYDQGFDLVFSIGTTSVFPYIAQPVMFARRLGIPSIEINPGTTEVSSWVDHRIRTGASSALQAIWAKAYS
jgi:NAD-dependent deacetylase